MLLQDYAKGFTVPASVYSEKCSTSLLCVQAWSITEHNKHVVFVCISTGDVGSTRRVARSVMIGVKAEELSRKLKRKPCQLAAEPGIYPGKVQRLLEQFNLLNYQKQPPPLILPYQVMT